MHRAHRVPVPDDEPLVRADPKGYADAFEVRLADGDDRSAEAFARCALEDAPWLVREMVWFVHRHVLRLRLAPRSAPGHVFGWRIVTSEPDVVQLEAVSPLLGRGVIVGRRPDPARAVITTYVFFRRPTIGRAVWFLTGPLHRRVAVLLLERAAAGAARPRLAGVR